jgi:hypothetical protein
MTFRIEDIVFTLDLAHAHMDNLYRAAALSQSCAAVPAAPSRLRRLVTRARHSR